MSYGHPSSARQFNNPMRGQGVGMGITVPNGPNDRIKDRAYIQYQVSANAPTNHHNHTSNRLANETRTPQNHYSVAHASHQNFQLQNFRSKAPAHNILNQQQYPLVSPPSKHTRFDHFANNVPPPTRDSFEFERSISDSLGIEKQDRPSLPPKIPIDYSPPSSNVPNNNTVNELSGQGQQDFSESHSDTGSSVDELIDRYMEEITQLDDDTPAKISQIRNDKKQELNPLSKEFELDSPPPYEELDNLPSTSIYPKNEKSTYRPKVRALTNIEGNSKEPRPTSTRSHNSVKSENSSMKSLPYPIDDPVVEIPEEVVPMRRSRGYTDELLEELKNTNIKDADQDTVANPSKETSSAGQGSQQTDPIERFIKSRDDALQNYKIFSVEIQLNWAKALLEAIDDPQIVNHINTNGQRIKPLVNPKDIKKNKIKYLNTSIKVLKRLSDIHNDAESQAILGDLYSGYTLLDLTEKDSQKGFEFYLRATKGKNPNATYKTGCCLEHGVGCKRDMTKCFYFYEKSALLGDSDGMCKLGIIYIKGLLGQAKSAQKSIYWLNKAILTNKTAVLPIFILAKIHETDVDTLSLKPHKNDVDAEVVKELQRLKIYQDFKTALQLYLKAAKLGHTKSQSLLGYSYEYGSMGCSVDPRMSIYWYSKAAEKGDLNSEMGLSGWYLTGAEGLLTQSDTEAYLWAKKASDKGLAKAEYAVGYFNEVGVGTSKNLIEAKKWYKIAASQGHSKAIKKLENWR